MKSKSQLHNYQLAAVQHIIHNTHCALFLDMGLGKTVSTLTAIDFLLSESELFGDPIRSVLIVAPKRVAESVWQQETQNWEHLKHLKVSIITGSEKQRREALRVKAHIYTIAVNNIAWLCGIFGGSMLPFDMLGIDESSCFKDHGSQRFTALKQVQPCFKRVVELTGTPSPNSLIDLWPQLYLLDRGKRLGKNITAYREGFFAPVGVDGVRYSKYAPVGDSADRIYNLIGDLCISMKAKDYLELPERITNIVRVPMPDKLRKEYKEFEREKVLELFEADTPITAANAAALCNKLLQFANGAVYDAERNWYVVHTLKLDALEEIMESAQGSPVLVIWTFKHDADRIEKRFKKYKPRRLDGDKDIRDWNAGKIPMMLMHPASGGHGLNLQHGGHTIAWFGQTWSAEQEQQVNTRIDRQGQKRNPIIHKIVLEGSMDERVIKTQEMKEKGQNGLMEAVKLLVKKHLG